METQPRSVPVSGTPAPHVPLRQQEPARLRSSSSSDMRDESSEEFTCNICTDRPTDAVVTPCGHIFCWSCLYRWLEDKAKPCPLCKVMVGLGNITPVYGGRTRSSRESSIPPRPSARLLHGSADTAVDGYIVLSTAFRDEETPIVPVCSSWLRDTLRRTSLLEGLERDAHMQTLRSRAVEEFRAIRESRPPSSIGWIAEASGSFDPSVRSNDDARLSHDLKSFIKDVLLPQSEFFPGYRVFRASWWPYYKALKPRGLFRELFADFTESWGKHFLRAWDRAGCPDYPASAGEPRLPTTGSDDAGHESVGDSEWIDATEYERSQESRAEVEQSRIGQRLR